MKTIYKYEISPRPTSFKCFEGAKVLSAQVQKGQPTLWVLIDTSAPPREIEVTAIPTGAPVPDGMSADNFVSTLQLMGGDFVIHVFARLV